MTDATRREKNRVISMFRLDRPADKRKEKPRRLFSFLTLYKESCQLCCISDGRHMAAGGGL